MVCLVPAIACANITNLLLARAAARRREIAVRLSIGAGRARVIRQLLTESILLALLGGALGAGFAVLGIRALTLLLAKGREDFRLRADLDWHVLAAVAALSMLTGLLFGLAPALQATRMDLTPALKESRTGEQRRHGILSLSRMLIASQIAITLLIVIAAGLFTRTLSNLAAIDLEFNANGVLTFSMDARKAGHIDPEIVAFYQGLQRQFSVLPGVSSVSLSNNVLIGTGVSGTNISLPGGAKKNSRVLTIGPGFFHTMQVPILFGREVEDRDRTGAPMVAVVNQAFAKLAFGDRNPLGQHIGLPPRMCKNCDIEIVGVSANPLYGDLKRTAPPIVYLPYAQSAWGPVSEMYFELRTAGNPLGYVHTVREIVHRADDRLPLADIRTQRAWIDEGINQEITFARLCGTFALLALAIACVGLYGTMSYHITWRAAPARSVSGWRWARNGGEWCG